MEYGRLREIGERLAEHAPDPFRGYEISGDEIVMMMSRSRPHRWRRSILEMSEGHHRGPVRSGSRARR